MRRTWLLVAGAGMVVVAAALLARGGGAPATIEDRVQAVSAGLRCPVCQNLSVADSPSRLAKEMRAEVEEQLRAGRTDEEVRSFFVARYGEWVLLEPRSLLPFLVPIAAVVLGLGAWAVFIRRRPRIERTEVSDAERRRIEGDLRSLEEGA
jgi:cytochrome c-type biogenesis protein CcmH